MLQAEQLDAVAICVPVAWHLQEADRCIRAGIPLLIEKPLAADAEQGEKLVALAAAAQSPVAVAFNLRCHRLVREAREWIRSGALGEIEAVRSRWTSAIRTRQALPEWRNARRTGGGALFEIAVHHFDLWRFLMDTEIVRVNARKKPGRFDDESVTLTAELANGALASGLFSEHTGDGNDLEIYGRKGILELSIFRFDGLQFSPVSKAPGLSTRLQQAVNTAAQWPRGLAIARKGGDFLMSYQAEWQAFLAGLQQGQALPATVQDGHAALRAVLAAAESADSGREVEL
jgi:predicted dehydrogenase